MIAPLLELLSKLNVLKMFRYITEGSDTKRVRIFTLFLLVGLGFSNFYQCSNHHKTQNTTTANYEEKIKRIEARCAQQLKDVEARNQFLTSIWFKEVEQLRKDYRIMQEKMMQK